VWPLRIFVCYRREDAAPWAGRLHDALSERFGAANIFQDVEAVRPGESFVEAMDAAVAQADVMLVVIGPRWTDQGNDGASRLDSADDYVRRELEVALAYGKRMLPALVGGARMPTVGQVPDGLRPIVTRQAVVLHDESWHADVEDLARALDDRRPPKVRRTRRLAVAGVAVLLLAAVGVTYALTRGDGDGATAADNGAKLVTASGEPTSCLTPGGQGWDDLGVRSRPGSGSGTNFDFDVTSGATHGVDGGATEVVFVVKATDTSPSSQNLYADGWTVVPAEGFRQTCFTKLGGGLLIDPGDTATAFVGFTGTGTVENITALDVHQRGGDTYRLDLEKRG
jgi:TIR domain